MANLQQLILGGVTSQSTARSIFDSGFDTTSYSTTSTAFTTRQSLSTTESAGQKFATFWTSSMNHADITTDAIVRLADGTTERQRFDIQVKDTLDRWSVGGLYAYDGGSNRTFNLQHATETSTSSTLKELSTVSLSLLNDDVYQHSDTTSTTTSSTYQTKCSVTIPTTGYYLVFGSAALASSGATDVDNGTMNLSPKARIFNGTTAFGEQINGHRVNTANFKPYNHVTVQQFTAGATISLQYASEGTHTVSIKQATLLCIFLGTDINNPTAFPKVLYQIDNNSVEDYSGTTNVFTSKGSLSTTSLNTANKHLVLATGLHCGWNFENASISRLEVNSATSLNGTTDFRNEGTTDEGVTSYDNTNFASLMVARTYNFTGVSTIHWEWTRTGGTRATLRNANIVIIDLGIPV